ncbi:unknown [Prevotella sp. CAG:592]|nr:unknown [Prevotella sp. CAG:592]
MKHVNHLWIIPVKSWGNITIHQETVCSKLIIL